ncbi:MAG: glycosyltransferase family 9 protein [wastewater metagenome]|nr:glycosyltransferase family 9 protein [Candidatus Loosdrechtia aerotolerans]
MKKHFSNPKNILVVRLGAMGDVVHVIPAVKNLRAAFPCAYIAWLIEDKLKDLAESIPEIDEVIVFPRKQWQNDLKHPRKYGKILSELRVFLQKLRYKRYDITLDFHGNFKSGLLTFLSNAKTKVGFSKEYCKEFNFIFSNKHITPRQKKIHRVHKYQSLVHGLGITTSDQKPSFSIPDSDHLYINNFIQQNNLHEKPIAIIHPGTSVFGKFKRWQSKNYAILADQLIQKLQYSVIFTWGPSEYTIVEEIMSLMHQRATIACRTSSAKQLIALLQRADLFIGCDTGPTHIASCMGIPTIALFGPKDPVIYAPYGENTITVRKDISCSPCERRTCSHVTCINSIIPEDIFREISNLHLTRKEI